MSQFKFLVMTKKNSLPYELFLSLNMSDFNLFFTWKLQQPSPFPEKSYALFSCNPPLKAEILSSPPPPFWKFGWRQFNSPFPHKKTNQEKPRLNWETRFISDTSWDLTEIFSNQYFMKLTLLNLSKISVSLVSV